MKLLKILRNQGIISAIAIGLLLSSYLFTVAYNISAGKFGEISAIAKTCMFLTILFLFLFLIGFIIFLVSVFKLNEVSEIFMNPGKVSIISIILLLCSYLSTVMNNFTSRIFGELSSIAQIFFYLGIVFIVFFIVAFIAMLVSLSNKFLYRKI